MYMHQVGADGSNTSFPSRKNSHYFWVPPCIQEAVENRMLQLSFPRHWGSFWQHFTWKQRLPNGVGLETHFSNELAPCWVTTKLQPHSQEKHWRGLWPSAVHRGALYFPRAVKPGGRRNQRGTRWEWLLHNGVCVICISGKFPNNVLQLL